MQLKLSRIPLVRRLRRGSALLMTLVTVMALAMTALSLVATGAASLGETRAIKDDLRSRYVAEAGLAQSMAQLRAGGTGALGNAQAPVAYGRDSFWVSRTDPANGVVRLTATGAEDQSQARVELTLRKQIVSLWAYGAFGDQSLGMDSNARVDSYNSKLGTYASQALNGSGSNAYALTNGDVGSNGNILMKQNSKVWGDATCGPTATTTVMGNAVCAGSTAPSSQVIAMPSISVPTLTSLGDKTVSGTLNLASGNYRYNTLMLKTNAIVNVTGPAKIVVSNLTLRSGSKLQIVPSGGPVTIYVIDDLVVNSNTTLGATNYDPSKLDLELLSDNVIDPNVVVDLDVIDFDSNAKMYGTIYAPNAHVEIDSNFELFGAMVAHSIDLDSNSRIHYDEALLASKGGGAIVWQRVCWRALAD